MQIAKIKNHINLNHIYSNAFFVSLLAIILSVVYWLARMGFEDNSFSHIFLVLGVSLLLLNTSDIFVSIKAKKEIKDTWYNSQSAMILLGLFAVVIFGLLSPLVNLFVPLAVLGFIFFILILYSYIKSAPIKSVLTTLLFCLLFSAWVIGAVWATGYQNPLFVEKLVLGKVSLDTLFHTDVANIIRTYNFPSTGLAGLPYLHYHWGSHAIFAEISKLLRLSIIDFYNLAYPVIFIPLLIKTFLVLVVEIRKVLKWPLVNDWKFWSIFILGFTGILPLTVSAGLNIITPVIFASESYLIGLLLTFAFIGLSINYFSSNKIFQKKDFSDFLYFLIVVPLMFALIGLGKISLLFLVFVIASYLFIRYGLYKKFIYLLSFLISILVFAISYQLTKVVGASQISAFAFIHDYVVEGYRPFFILFYYFWAWLYIILRFKRLKIYTFTNLTTVLKQNKILDVEILVAFAFVGFIPGAVFSIGGGSAGYFSDLQRWLAIILVVAYSSTFLLGAKVSKDRGFSLGKINLSSFFFIILLAPFVYSSISNIISVDKSFVYDNVDTRMGLLPKNSAFKSKGHLKYMQELMRDQKMTLVQALVQSLNVPQAELEKGANEKYIMVRYLKDLDSMPMNIKNKTVLFIPQDNQVYWNMVPYRGIQFVAPALLGMATINGIQPFIPQRLDQVTLDICIKNLSDQEKEIVLNKFIKVKLTKDDSATSDAFEYVLRQDLSDEEKNYIYDLFSKYYFAKLKDYGFESYQITENEQDYLNKTNSDEKLCKESTSKGFDNIIIISTDENDLPLRRDITCQ